MTRSCTDGMDLTGLTDGQVRTMSQVEISISGPEMDMGQFLRPNSTQPDHEIIIYYDAEAARTYDTIRYDTRCYFNVRSKADIVNFIFRTEPKTKKWKTEKQKKVKKRVCSEVSVNSPGNPWSHIMQPCTTTIKW